MADHRQEAAMTRTMPMPDSPRLMMALVGPVVGIICGIVIGLLAWVVGKIVKPRQAVTTSANA
jgi:cobalamin synthase